MNIAIKLTLVLITALLLPMYSVAQSQQHPEVKKTSKKKEIVHETPEQKNYPVEKVPSPKPPAIDKPISPIETPINSHPKQNTNASNEKKWVHKFTNNPTAVFTAGLFIVTLGLWWATVLLVKNSKKTAKSQLRAYVFADMIEGEKLFFNEDNCLSAPLIIKNYGQTPAHRLKCNIFIHPHILPLSESLDHPRFEGGSRGCLAPGQTFRTYPALDKELSDTIITGIQSGEAGVHVWGYLEYVDIFETTQKTKFRMISTGDDFARYELAYCEDGNEAT